MATSALVRPKLFKIVVRQSNRIYRECKTAHMIRHALMQLDAEEHYQLLIRIFKADKELEDISKLMYNRKEEVDGVLKASIEFLQLSREISLNKNSDSRRVSFKKI